MQVCTASNPVDGAVSRAFFKLREAAARCEIDISSKKHAIDVGAPQPPAVHPLQSIPPPPAQDRTTPCAGSQHYLRRIAPLSAQDPTTTCAGASPGGWSCFLAQSGCALVSSVDPGKLHLPATAACRAIDHLQMRVEQALPILEARGAELDMYCCDMNEEPSIAVDYFVQVVDATLYA